MGIDDDADLVHRAQRGDAEALHRLFAELRPRVQRICWSRLDASEAEDVCQEIMMAVWRNLAGYRPERADLGAFVHGITTHKIMDALRARYRCRTVSVDQFPEPAGAEPGPEEIVLRRARDAAVGRLLTPLATRDRHVLVMRAAFGMPSGEVGQAVGATSGAVRVCQHRAMRRVREVQPHLAVGVETCCARSSSVIGVTGA